MSKLCSKSEARSLSQTLVQFYDDERGATAVEYSLIAGSMSAVIVGAVYTLGGTVLGLFQSVLAAVAG